MKRETNQLNIPAQVNGLTDNNFCKIVQTVFRLARNNNAGGVQVDPVQFERMVSRQSPHGW